MPTDDAGDRPDAGETPQRQFRLSDETVRRLDWLVKEFAREAGDRETRTGVVRKLINREYNRRRGRKGS